jgi:hypothetical protein
MMQVLERPDAEESVRHLNQQDLEAYATGRLAASRLDDCRSHLESCDACRAELEDIRTFQSDSASFQRPEPVSNRYEPPRRTRRRNTALPLVASATAAVVVVAASASAVIWWHHHKPTVNKPAPVGAAVAPSSVAPPSLAAPSSPTPQVRTQPRDTRVAVEKPNPPKSNISFALLSPLGDAIFDPRPQFSWQALPGAIGYTVEIVDEGLHPVQHSPAQRATVWRPRLPLHRGHTYLWQVTATLHGGAKVVASQPSLIHLRSPSDS